jgi:hypothetical protein
MSSNTAETPSPPKEEKPKINTEKSFFHTYLPCFNLNWSIILITLFSFLILFLSEYITVEDKDDSTVLYEAITKNPNSNFKIFFSVPNLIHRNRKINLKLNIISLEYQIQERIELQFTDPSNKLFINETFDVPKIGNNIEMNITLKNQINLKFDDIPSKFFINLKYKKEEELFKVKMRMEWFPLSLNYSHFKKNVHCLVESINVILWGIPGVGKSSFINTQLTSVSNQIMENAASMDVDESLTQEYQLHRLVHGNQYYLNMIDTFGLDDTNYHHDIQKCSLNGSLPNFKLMDAKNYVKQPNSTLCFNTSVIKDKIEFIRKKIHAVVIPLTVDQVSNADEKVNKIINDCIYVSAQMKYNPIVLISWRSKDFFNTTRQQLVKELAHELTGVNSNKIFIFFAYSNETKKIFIVSSIIY